MVRNQFFNLLFWSALEAQFMAWLIQINFWILAVFVGLMLLSNIVRAYNTEKIAKQNGLL